MLVTVLDPGHVLVPGLPPLSNNLLLVLSVLTQPLLHVQRELKRLLQVVNFAGLHVDAFVADACDTQVFWLFEYANEGGFDFERLEQVDLRLGLRETVQYPAVDATVGLFEPGLHQRVDVVIRYHTAFLKGELYDLTDVGVLGGLVAEETTHAHIHKAEPLRNSLALC